MNKCQCALSSLVFTVIVLHNSLDKVSRQFVATIPAGKDVQIINWYQDDGSRYSYTGPPPSAFPTVIVPLPSDGSLGTLRMPKTWSDAQAVLSSPESFVQVTAPNGSTAKVRKTPCETITQPGQYIGGQTIPEIQTLLKNPFLSPAARKAISKTLPAAGASLQTNLPEQQPVKTPATALAGGTP